MDKEIQSVPHFFFNINKTDYILTEIFLEEGGEEEEE